MKLIELFTEGEVIPFDSKPAIPTNKPVHKTSDKPMPGRKNQDEIDNLVRRYVNLGVGSQILYNNRLAQIIKAPDEHRFIISFDDTGEKKIISKKDNALDLIPTEHLSEVSSGHTLTPFKGSAERKTIRNAKGKALGVLHNTDGIHRVYMIGHPSHKTNHKTEKDALDHINSN